MVDTFQALDTDRASVNYDEFGETITYNGASVVAIPNITYRQIGADAMAVESQVTFDLRYSDIAAPARGDAIVYNAVTYTVDVALQVNSLEFTVMTH